MADDCASGRLSLRVAIPNPETRARLVAIRTGLTLPHEQVDALVAAGETMIDRDAGTIAAFLRPAPSAEQIAGRR
jgi:hypothetical protein